MRLYHKVCMTCKNNRAEMPSQGVQVPQQQTAPKEMPQRPTRGIIIASSWQESQGQQRRRHQTRSWPSSYTVYTTESAETAVGETSPCGEPKGRAQSVSPDFAGNFKGASAVPSKPLIHHQRHNLKNKFQVLSTLGEGTYGKVKLAIDKGTGEHVAIKYIKKTKIQDETDQARIRREIQIMSSLRHQHIVNVREVFEKKDKIVLVMDYAPGGELYDYLNKMGRLTEEEARRIFRQIVSAVHHCHENGVVHRDLKLENIILDNDGNVKIADFGLSNYFQPDSTLSTFCGSPLYASPEIVNGNPYHGPEVDVWSLGVILYTLVYGAMPFESSNVAILRQQICHGLYSEPIIASEAAGLIHHMLTVTPSRRATMEDILHHWWVNFNYSNMPNNMPYKPDPELPDTTSGSTTDLSFNTTELPAHAEDNQKVHSSADSDVELDVGQRVCSVRIMSNSMKDITSSSSEAASHVSGEQTDRQSGDDIATPASIPSALSKLPQDVLEILLNGCSKKTLNALFGTGQASPGFDTETSRDIYKETSKNGEEESRGESPDFAQKSHAVSELEKRPARGILKRKGKFSGGDSGCVINEEMSRHDESSVHASDYLHQKTLPIGTNDPFAWNECKSNLINNNACCGLNDNSCTAISHSALNASYCLTDSQLVHEHRCSRIPQNVQDNRSSQDIFNKAIPRATSSPQGEYTQTSAHDNAKLNFTCDCKSTVDSAKTVTVPKSILKNCKKPSMEDGVKRLSISSYGSNSSIDLFDLSYDSADSGHFVHPRLHFSPTGKINIDDSGYDDHRSVESDQSWRHVDDSKLVVPIISSRNSREPCQRSKSHSI
ncbi:hypothetical protein BsWGS_13576 [Bradybaena similaris]